MPAPPVTERQAGEGIASAPLPEPFVDKGEGGKEGTTADKKTSRPGPPAPLPGGTAGTAIATPGPALGGTEKEQVKPQARQVTEKNEAAKTPPEPREDGTAPSPTKGKFFVQVGSFKSRGKAKEFCNKITPLGFKPRVAVADLPNKGKWFRVMIDGFASREEAKRATAVLARNIKGVSGIIRPAP